MKTQIKINTEPKVTPEMSRTEIFVELRKATIFYGNALTIAELNEIRNEIYEAL